MEKIRFRVGIFNKYSFAFLDASLEGTEESGPKERYLLVFLESTEPGCGGGAGGVGVAGHGYLGRKACGYCSYNGTFWVEVEYGQPLVAVGEVQYYKLPRHGQPSQ